MLDDLGAGMRSAGAADDAALEIDKHKGGGLGVESQR
jgi:hypothetical protein